ncbi:MAG: hypothetical protein HBSAPP03_18450 [Phycisphaerae bacterium]|nr:MAG: hypothetical protein HBSAPP03_18450 [Phycisphaerae bacterium]
MLRATLRWTLILFCLFAIGPAVRILVLRVLDDQGGHAVTLALNATPGAAVLAGLAAFGAAGVVGALGAHLFSMGTGLLCAGITLAWARWGLGTVDAMIRQEPTGAFRFVFAGENAVALLLTACMAGLFVFLASRRQPAGAQSSSPGGLGALVVLGGEYRVKAMLAALAVGLVAGAGMTWLDAISALRGQTLMAVFGGALVCGAVGQLIASSMRCTITPVLPVLGMLVVALAGPILAGAMHGAGLLDASNRGSLLGLAMPVSLDWAAGSLLGGPIGISWAGAMLDARAVDD